MYTKLLICIFWVANSGLIHANLVYSVVLRALSIQLAEDELAKRCIALLVARLVLPQQSL